MDTLKYEIKERRELDNELDTVTVLDEARRLRINRINFAISLLEIMRSNGLAASLKEKVVMKSKCNWINKVLEFLESKLSYARIIDGKKFLAVLSEAVRDFFNKFCSFISLFDKLLIFTTDETMMQCTHNVKNIVPKNSPSYQRIKPPEMPHITAMRCTKIICIKIPLLIILKDRKTRPNEINNRILSGSLLALSTESAKDTAYMYFNYLMLVWSLKDKFTFLFTQNLINTNMYSCQTMSENMRKIAIESFVGAWNSTCKKNNCEAAARITGIYPVDPDAPKKNWIFERSY